MATRSAGVSECVAAGKTEAVGTEAAGTVAAGTEAGETKAGDDRVGTTLGVVAEMMAFPGDAALAPTFGFLANSASTGIALAIAGGAAVEALGGGAGACAAGKTWAAAGAGAEAGTEAGTKGAGALLVEPDFVARSLSAGIALAILGAAAVGALGCGTGA